MNSRALILILVTLLLSGCGYHHPASRRVGGETITIHVGTWENRTNEIALEGLLLHKTADWLQQSRSLRLESDPGRADYLLSGTIETVNNPATAFSSGDRATTLKAWVKVTYRLVDQTGGKTLWEINAIRERIYQAGDDAVRSRSNKEEALAIIAEELAEQIYLKVVTTLNQQPQKKPAN